MAKRKIVHIDESKCNGCGQCIISCAEGALKIVDGKARLVSDKYCDGLGACLGECPQDAIRVEEREAAEFDEKAVNAHKKMSEIPACPALNFTVTGVDTAKEPVLNQWPVQLALVPAAAPFLRNADVVLMADCVPFACAGFRDYFKNKALLVACPKLDNFEAHQEKLTEIMKQSGLKNLSVVHMEVPCCSGLVFLAKQAKKISGSPVPIQEITIKIDGTRQS